MQYQVTFANGTQVTTNSPRVSAGETVVGYQKFTVSNFITGITFETVEAINSVAARKYIAVMENQPMDELFAQVSA